MLRGKKAAAENPADAERNRLCMLRRIFPPGELEDIGESGMQKVTKRIQFEKWKLRE